MFSFSDGNKKDQGVKMNKVRQSQSLSSALRRDKLEKEKDRSIKADSVRGFKTQNLIEKRKKKKQSSETMSTCQVNQGNPR